MADAGGGEFSDFFFVDGDGHDVGINAHAECVPFTRLEFVIKLLRLGHEHFDEGWGELV